MLAIRSWIQVQRGFVLLQEAKLLGAGATPLGTKATLPGAGANSRGAGIQPCSCHLVKVFGQKPLPRAPRGPQGLSGLGQSPLGPSKASVKPSWGSKNLENPVEMVGQKGTLASRIADQVEEHGGTPFLRELPV